MGDVTERDYFTCLEAYLHAAFPHAHLAIYVETPNHSGLSSPEQVYELLEQCAEVRRPRIVLKQLSRAFKRKYGRNLEKAIARAASLKNKMPALLDHVGTNVGELVSEILDYCKSA